MLDKFPFFNQRDQMDCGGTCLRMITKYFGKNYSSQYLNELVYTTREGVNLLGICTAAELIGFRTLSVKIDIEKLYNDVPLPCILHWNQDHFVVLYEIKSSFFNKNKHTYYIADPAAGKVKLSEEEVKKYWSVDNDQGIVLILDPTKEFYEKSNELDYNKGSKKWNTFSFLKPYVTPYNKLIIQLFIGLFIGSILQFIFPFLTQSIVDIGIRNQNIHFVYMVLLATLMLFIGEMTMELIRSRILLHMSSRINISLISDFLIKLMKLPISFFDSKLTGDIIMRIADHSRIQAFLTGSSLSMIFSMFNLVIFGIVLLIYSTTIFTIYFIGTALYLLWISLFLKYRKELDYKRFYQSSARESNMIQLIQGMQEVKLHNAELRHRWNWEKIQAQGFKIDIQALTLSNIELVGSNIIHQLKNIIITILSAKLVIDGELTLGMMLSVQYIIGQLNVPIFQIISFVHEYQAANLSLERLKEIHSKPNEELDPEYLYNDIPKDELLLREDIIFKDVSFKYIGPSNNFVLKNLTFNIPYGKTTAIVGSSGSGKTTLLKLIMKFYEPTSGLISLGHTNLNNIRVNQWRNSFGAVLQDGFIFSDTIARNIVVKDEIINKSNLLNSTRIANLEEFVDSLPLGFNTKIGQEGVGISMGQKQRLLIARAIYKEPKLLIFDEATNSLDANNERQIVKNLDEYSKNKTSIIVAHRLSTVKNADNIIVLEKGEIVEQGTHAELTKLNGYYYQLVKNQLELGM